VTTRWKKVVRDFWRERTRTALVVLAVSVGISGFSAVLASYAVLTRELAGDYLATQPASATLRLDAVDEALVAAVAARPGIAAAEARRVVTGRIKTGPVEWRGLTLFVIRDFAAMRVALVAPQQGAWPPAAGEVLLERDALRVARAGIGDSVTVRTTRGAERALRVSGTVHDVGQAQARMENAVYGYLTPETLALLGEEPYLDLLKIVVAGNPFDEAHVRKVAADLAAWLAGQGRVIRRTDVPPPGKHPHADIMGLLLLIMAGFGLLVAAFSAILVANLMVGLMASQVREIGVMKAVGGTRRQIAAIYFGQALLLGAAAIVVSWPAGVLGSRALTGYLAVLLNFDVSSRHVPLWVYLCGAVVGLVVPLLAAAYPVLTASRVSVREALADFGVSASGFGTRAFDRLVSRIGGLARPVLLAIRNSLRRRARAALTLVTLTAAGVFFMSSLNVRASFVNTLDRLFAARKFDLTVSFASLYPLDRALRAVRGTPGVVRAEGWIQTEGSIAAPGDAAVTATGHAPGSLGPPHGAGTDRFTVVALPADTTLLEPDVAEGRRLQAGDADAVLVNTRLAARLPQLRVGREVALQIGHRRGAWRVIGVAREAFSPPTAYVPLGHLEATFGHAGMVNSLRLVLDRNDPASIATVRAGLDRRLEEEGLRVAGSAAKSDGRYSFDQHMLMIYVFLLIMAALLAAVGGLGLTTTMSLNVLERRREMGVLRAVGASPPVVWLIVVAESLVIALASWAAAGLLARPVGRGLGEGLVSLMFSSGVDFAFDSRGLLVWLAVSLVLGAVASLLPAWRACRRPVREAIAYE
jgi:putative ABC transport system permease protein